MLFRGRIFVAFDTLDVVVVVVVFVVASFLFLFSSFRLHRFL
jgi:hypothetical protein